MKEVLYNGKIALAMLMVLLVSCGWVIASPTVQMKARYDERDVFTKDLKLFVQGKEYFIKGINYSPQPLGKPTNAGFCSAKRDPLNRDQNACIDEDYFDGSETDNGGRPKPVGPWWQKVWERDLPVIKELGANTIRVYHMVSITKTLIEKFPDIYGTKFNKAYGAIHTPFLDACEANGLKVIVPIVSEEDILTQTSETDLYRYIEARVDEVGNHNALLMWCIGNELGLYMKPELRKTVNKAIRKVREYTLQKWNRIIPITTSEIDLPPSYVPLAAEMEVDVFTANAGYRDVFIGQLWDADPNPQNNFPGWATLSKKWDLPVLIGEFGMHDADLQTQGRPDWVNQQWQSIVSRKKDGCIGGAFFEFSNEPMKPDAQKTMGLVKYDPAMDPVSGKDSTNPGVFVPDVLVRKPIIFDALKSGHPTSASKKYCYSSDVYQLTGTTMTALDLKTVTPKPFVEKTQPLPSHSSPVPSGSSSPQPAHSSNPSPQVSQSAEHSVPQTRPSDSQHGNIAASGSMYSPFILFFLLALSSVAVLLYPITNL